MAINISFADFDTVCYSNQHNIIELINHAVGLSIEVNINAGNITNVQNNLNNLADQVQQGQAGTSLEISQLENRLHDLERSVTLLEHAFDAIAERLDAVYNFTPDFDKSVTGVIIDNLRKGILP